MKTSFFAVGHSNRTLEFLVGLLLGYEIERLVDVRTVPRSRHNPQFNRDSLPQNLRSVGIAYTLYRGQSGEEGREGGRAENEGSVIRVISVRLSISLSKQPPSASAPQPSNAW